MQAGSDAVIRSRARLGWISALPGYQLSLATGVLRGYGFCLLLQFLDDPAGPGRIHVDPRAHRARQGDATNVATLCGRGLRAHDLVDQRRVVLDEAPLVEALLADGDVDIRAAVRAVLELAGLRVADGLA